MSSKKLGVLALVAVLVIGVLVIVAPQDDPPAPAEEALPAPEVADDPPAEEAPPAQEVAEDPPAEEAPPAPIPTPGEIVPPAGFTAVLTRDVEGAIMTQYIGSGTAEDAFAALTSVTDAGPGPLPRQSPQKKLKSHLEPLQPDLKGAMKFWECW